MTDLFDRLRDIELEKSRRLTERPAMKLPAVSAIACTSPDGNTFVLAIAGIRDWWDADIPGMLFVRMSRAGEPVLMHGTARTLDAIYSSVMTTKIAARRG